MLTNTLTAMKTTITIIEIEDEIIVPQSKPYITPLSEDFRDAEWVSGSHDETVSKWVIIILFIIALIIIGDTIFSNLFG